LVISKREQASGRGKEYHSGCKGRLLGFQKGETDCKRVEWLENIVDVQERVKEAFWIGDTSRIRGLARNSR